jgi:hypothetical protein
MVVTKPKPGCWDSLLSGFLDVEEAFGVKRSDRLRLRAVGTPTRRIIDVNLDSPGPDETSLAQLEKSDTRSPTLSAEHGVDDLCGRHMERPRRIRQTYEDEPVSFDAPELADRPRFALRECPAQAVPELMRICNRISLNRDLVRHYAT